MTMSFIAKRCGNEAMKINKGQSRCKRSDHHDQRAQGVEQAIQAKQVGAEEKATNEVVGCTLRQPNEGEEM